MTALEINRLSVERGGRIVLDGVQILVNSGQAMIVTGPNGVGKTTLLRTIAGYLPVYSGAIELKGGEADREIAEQLHYVGHHNAIKLAMTVRENLRFWAAFLGKKSPEDMHMAVETALKRFHLSALAEIPAAYLSAGQKRRTSLARLLVAPRPLWLLDEPTVALDAASCKTLIDVGNAHLRNGGLILAATHLPLDFEGVAEVQLSYPAEGQ